MTSKRILGRRDFVKGLTGLGLLSLSPLELLFASEPETNQIKRLSWLSNRGVSFEGQWTPRKIEGKIPSWLEGSLFRIGPGSKEVYGKALNHFFDGDGYLSAFRFSGGQVSLESRFVETIERQKERAARKMLYHDFGTKCEGLPHGYKDPPNIHVVPFAHDLLALSEASHPTRIKKESLESLGAWNFNGALPRNVTFTAHPKVDPRTGDVFAFGISRALKPELKIYRIERETLRLSLIATHSLGGFYPVHDMLMTENFLVFTISPIKINLLRAATLRGPIADALEYDNSQPLRVIIVSKDASSKPVELVSAPSGLIFHHVNAHEESEGKKIIFESFVIEDGSAYEIFKKWGAATMPPAPKTQITRFTVDLEKGSVLSREKLSENITTDFPCIDQRKIGQKLSFFHSLESDLNDPLAFNILARHNLSEVTVARSKASSGEVFGEPVFVGNSTLDVLLHLGYRSQEDETYLDIRNALTLEAMCRIWLGRYLPLGFHGSFVADESAWHFFR